MKLMFLDESGDHNLDPDKIDPTYPIFVLCGCIFEEKYYQEEVIKKFNQFKKDFFDSEDVILHLREMTRPTKTKIKGFYKFSDQEFRNKFYQELTKFIDQIEFTLVACVIKKQSHFEKYGVAALDPYLLSFDNLLSVFMLEIKKGDQGKIIAERRNSILDNQLELAWLNTKINGTEISTGSDIKERIENLYMVPKSQNEAGLQIADLLASPIGRHIFGAKVKPGHEVDYSVLEKKFSKREKDGENLGLIVLPK